jgi:hypothetical protein
LVFGYLVKGVEEFPGNGADLLKLVESSLKDLGELFDVVGCQGDFHPSDTSALLLVSTDPVSGHFLLAIWGDSSEMVVNCVSCLHGVVAD